MSLLNRLEQIAKKITFLKKENEALQTKIKTLQAHQQNLETVVAAQKVEIFNLQEQNKIIKLAGSLSQNDKKENLLEQIDFLMEEIDECIKTIKT